MSDDPSITRLIQQLRADDPAEREAAASAIWQSYFPRLLALARSQLDRRVRVRADEEDVLQSMYKSFCARHDRGEFSLVNRDELWRLLVHMTLCKVRNTANHHTQAKRTVAREMDGDTDDTDASSAQWTLEWMSDHQPTPDEAVALEEAALRRLEALPPNLRVVALRKLDGHTNMEIANQLDCTQRTIERKLNLIRRQWERAIEGTADA